MLKLMQLELRKHNLGWYWKGTILATLAVVLLVSVLPYVDPELEDAFASYEAALVTIGMLIRAVFVIFASVLVSSFIIQEYNHKTITVLFTYPLPRKKLLAAKILLILLITVFSILVSNLAAAASFIGLNVYLLHLLPGIPPSELLAEQALQMLVYTLSAAGMSLIPLYIGMRKKSVPATIVSAVIIISLINTNGGGVSLSSYIAVPAAFGVIGMAAAYLSLRNIEHADIG